MLHYLHFIFHDEQFNSQYGLTQAGLEEYSRSYYEQNMMYNHQKQSSYAQSEGYHSYVSSDSSSTPFLDRLRQDSQLQSRAINWSQDFQTQNLNGSTNSISSSTGNINNECSESNSSTETLKWLGSMSDVSVVSQATNTSTLSASSQLIVHSSKVRTPQRHNSESVLYMNDESKMNGNTSNNSVEDLSSEQFQHRSSRSDNRLFPINTYTEQQPISLSASTTSLDSKLSSNHNWQSVADRINELEKQQQKQQAIHDHNKQHYTYLDPSKTHRVPNPTLKAFQKNAIQSYFERQQQQQQSIRLSKSTHHVATKSDDLTKTKSSSIVGGKEISKSNGNIASTRPQSLNLSLATSAVSLPTTPSSTPSTTSSQRSSISAWPNASPTTTNSSIMIGSKSSDIGASMKKNANDIAKMNMKNSAMSSAVALNGSEKQFVVTGSNNSSGGGKGNNGKSQSINKNLFTSFCEIKTENYPSKGFVEGNTTIDINGANKTNSTPPPLPRKSNVLRRTSSASEYSSIRDKMLQQNQHLSKDLLGAMIIGKIISIDDWVPERPPKNPSLRIPSPELPPPPNTENIPMNQDDPLPPPPPELLKSEPELKLNATSRRNSFAGQSNNTTRVKVNNIPLSPPAIPMRPKIVPTPIMTVNPVKNICQMPQELTVHAQRVIVPKSDENISFNQQQTTSTPKVAVGRASDSRVSVRKRAHNSKDFIGYIPAQQQSTPPPLKPRMRNQNEISNGNNTSAQNVFTPIVNKVR
ncbi:CLUMA_CG011304, isoform A [Clunio marinus]|uniref:CLUMA_CG011304, isoform A n=1 Tax=Clunio marinus TaxID=568069 RepID=A0A1J1ICK6_9DIPT|nr:CLUMA_CG011304, isoform A [Clunio marinus]